MKAAAFYVVCAVAAVVSSLLSWLTWGSTGPITNLGYHDFFGSGFVYVFAGAMAFVLTRKVGVRPGMYRPDPRDRRLPLLQPRHHDHRRDPHHGRPADGDPVVRLLLRARGAVRQREHVGHERRRRVQQPRPRVGGRCPHGRAHRLPDEELHLHVARTVRGIRLRRARIRRVHAVADVPRRVLRAAGRLRRLRVDAAQGDRRAQAHQPVPRRRVLRDPHGRAGPVGHQAERLLRRGGGRLRLPARRR